MIRFIFILYATFFSIECYAQLNISKEKRFDLTTSNYKFSIFLNEEGEYELVGKNLKNRSDGLGLMSIGNYFVVKDTLILKDTLYGNISKYKIYNNTLKAIYPNYYFLIKFKEQFIENTNEIYASISTKYLEDYFEYFPKKKKEYEISNSKFNVSKKYCSGNLLITFNNKVVTLKHNGFVLFKGRYSYIDNHISFFDEGFLKLFTIEKGIKEYDNIILKFDKTIEGDYRKCYSNKKWNKIVKNNFR